MLITMPYLAIKHETRVPSRSFRGERNSVSLTKVEVVVHQIQRPEMCQRALSVASTQSCRAPTRKQAWTPVDVSPKNQVHQEQVSSRTSINGPSVTHHQEPPGATTNGQQLGAVRSCKAARPSPTVTNSTVASSPSIWLELTGTTVWLELTGTTVWLELTGATVWLELTGATVWLELTSWK